MFNKIKIKGQTMNNEIRDSEKLWLIKTEEFLNKLLSLRDNGVSDDTPNKTIVRATTQGESVNVNDINEYEDTIYCNIERVFTETGNIRIKFSDSLHLFKETLNEYETLSYRYGNGSIPESVYYNLLKLIVLEKKWHSGVVTFLQKDSWKWFLNNNIPLNQITIEAAYNTGGDSKRLNTWKNEVYDLFSRPDRKKVPKVDVAGFVYDVLKCDPAHSIIDEALLAFFLPPQKEELEAELYELTHNKAIWQTIWYNRYKLLQGYNLAAC